MTDEATPGRYRKRPVEVVGIRWVDDNLQDVEEFIAGQPSSAWRLQEDRTLALWIEKSQTWGTVRRGDWVLAERDGVGFYPCTAEQFADTYEPAD